MRYGAVCDTNCCLNNTLTKYISASHSLMEYVEREAKETTRFLTLKRQQAVRSK